MPRYNVSLSYDKGDRQGTVEIEAESAREAVAIRKAQWDPQDGGRWVADLIPDDVPVNEDDASE